MSNPRPRILAGNWKLNFGPAEALEYFSKLTKELGGRAPSAGHHRVIFPPAYALGRDVQTAAAQAHVELGAQNVHWEDKGAFTGELSASALQSLGIHWVLIGHSERRQYFGETDETAAKRFRRAAQSRQNIVFCVGERLEDREAGKTDSILSRQLAPLVEALRELFPAKPAELVWSVAYEPVWAIGTGKTATSEQAEQAHRHIRRVLWDSLGLDTAQKTPILYGGSVTPENSRELLSQPNVDGVLVGGASLKPDGFARILQSL